MIIHRFELINIYTFLYDVQRRVTRFFISAVLCFMHKSFNIYHHYGSDLGQVLGTSSLACPFSRLFFSLELHETPSGSPWCLQAMVFSTSPLHRRGARD